MRTWIVAGAVAVCSLSHLANAQPTRRIDAAVEDNRGNVYFFSGDEYVRFSIKSDTSYKGYPQKIAGHWPGLRWKRDIDAAFSIGRKIYFFKNRYFTVFDVPRDHTDGPPRLISKFFKQWPFDRVDAAIAYGVRILFFRKNRWTAYSSKTFAPDFVTERSRIERTLAKFPITAAFTTGFKLYFFGKDQYVRWDYGRVHGGYLKVRRVPGYPRRIYGNWSGVWQARPKHRPGE